MDSNYTKKNKENITVLAICYDFDKTLSPDNMQSQGFIQSIKKDVKQFWDESNKLAKDEEMDDNLAYMYSMIHSAYGKFVLNKTKLKEYGSKVELFPGVESWFDRIKAYGKIRNVIIENYIISSGLKEMIEGTSIANKFEKIYANSYYYDDKGVALWPAQVINYTNKTQFLFRIEKGTLEVNDSAVNDYFDEDSIRVPFRNMIYIGDSDTDIPCMKLINSHSGHSIGVYNPKTKDKSKVYKMIRDKRIKYFTAADYSEGSELDNLVKAIIDKTVYSEILESFYHRNIEEYQLDYKNKDKDYRKKQDLIIELQNSRTYATTHTIIKKMSEIVDWDNTQKDLLFAIAEYNSQVNLILEDSDVKLFYKQLISSMNPLSENGKKIKLHID